MSEVVFRRLDHEDVVRRLREYATGELACRPEVREVVLIGSLVRDDWSASSDADVVVIVDQAEEPGPFRGPDYAPKGRVGLPVDVFVYTPSEAEAWGPRYRREVEEGVVLYRREG